MKKPEQVTENDWKLLVEKYPTNLEEIVKRIKEHYPVQYLIGNVSFYGYPIEVTQDVLIPRFETEYLVEKVLKRIKKLDHPKVLDIGTGSGCISIALAKNKEGNYTAWDISEKALEIAKKNAQQNEVSITFEKVDILHDEKTFPYDIIISNPPYIAEDEVVAKEVAYEPSIALYADNHGLAFYQKILEKISQSQASLKLIAFEIGYLQGQALIDLANNYFPTATVEIEKDLSGKDRYCFITFFE